MMKAVGISRYGDASVLEHWELPIPRPGFGEVLVEVHFAGVNFMDVHTRQGKYATSTTYPVGLPVTLGMEGAGVVVGCGDGVEDVAVGERVAWCLSWGSYAQYALVPAARLVRVSDELGLDMAAASLFQGCTAHYLIHDVAHLGPGSTCLVHAASGAIGQLMIQMAVGRGARVLATTSSATKADVARSLGASDVFDYGNGRFADDVLAATAGRGVDVTFDSLGVSTLRDSMRCTRTRGLLVNYGSVAGPLRDLDPLELGEAGSLFLTRPRLADYVATGEEMRRRGAEVFEGIARGDWVVQISGEFTLEDVHHAMADLEGRRQIGKAVVRL